MRTVLKAGLAVGLVVSGVLSGCGGGAQKIPITAPPIRPPVQAALPSTLLSGASTFSTTSFEPGVGARRQALAGAAKQCGASGVDVCAGLTGNDLSLCVVKQRLFCPGPTEILKLLDALDVRMAEVKGRSDGTEPCLAEMAVDRSGDVTFPGAIHVAHFLQCKDSSIGLGFGTKDGAWYFRQASNGTSWLFAIDAAGDKVDGYLWLSPDTSYSGSVMLLRLHASKSQGLVELVGTGTALGFCSLRYLSDSTHVSILINVEGPNNSCDSNGSGTTDAADFATLCLDATTLDEVPDGACNTLRGSKTLDLLGRQAVTAGSKSFAATAPAPNGQTQITFSLDELKALFADAADFAGLTEFKSAP